MNIKEILRESCVDVVCNRLDLNPTIWDYLLPWRAYAWQRKAMTKAAQLYTSIVLMERSNDIYSEFIVKLQQSTDKEKTFEEGKSTIKIAEEYYNSWVEIENRHYGM